MIYARTQNGDAPAMLTDLVRLRPETVQLWNGTKWTQVLAWQQNPRPDNPIELELRNGQRIGCTPEHVWPTQRGNMRADELIEGDIIQTGRLPEPCEPITPILLPDEIGWFVGLYLAEGNRDGNTIHIAGHVKEVERYEKLCQVARSYGGTCRVRHIKGNSATITLHGKMLHALIETYISGHDARDKHLSATCWKRSDAFLKAVLDGYLDGDGHYEPENKRWRIGFTRNYNLENDLRTVCARLGIQLRLKPTMSTNTQTGKEHPSFKGEIRFIKNNHHNNKDDGEIMHIGRSRARQFWDVTVADEPHLFALASGVLTHNCMPESVTDRPTSAHEHIFLLAKSERYYYDTDAIREPLRPKTLTTYGIKHRPQGNDALGLVKSDNWGCTVEERRPKLSADGEIAGANKRNVWTVASQPFPDAHFAVMPEKLVEPCILAGSSPKACEQCGAPWERITEAVSETWEMRKAAGAPSRYGLHGSKGTSANKMGSTLSQSKGWRPSCSCPNNTGSGRCVILDPFLGSGTVASVANRLGRHYLGIELNAAYIEMARRRVAQQPLDFDWS